MAKTHLVYQRNSLLELPLELLLKTSEYLSFADLWYLATSSRHCRVISHQIIWHRYHIDLSRPQLNTFNHIVHAALAYISRHGYNSNNTMDHTILQSVSNRLAVEIYDRSPLKNWEPCLDFFLDKTLGIILDHVFLDPLLDTVQKHATFTDLLIQSRKTVCLDHQQQQPILTNLSHSSFVTEFYPTRLGSLITGFLTTLYPTLIALFETEPTTEIHHRLLLNHINRHLDSLSSRYHNHHRRRLILNSASPRTARATSLAAVQHHHEFLRLNFRILIRLIGTLVQTELLSANDLDIITRQRIQFFFLTFQQVVQPPPPPPPHPSTKEDQHQICFYNVLKTNQHHSCWQMWLEEIEFQMEIFLDLTRAVCLLKDHQRQDLNTVSSLLDSTVNTLISTRSNHHQPTTTAAAATATTANLSATTTTSSV
ncbi:hypothetical protein BD770DRAFT_385993 [Pilaira anomala]|nr:hypothetical protein BD770DRAFT_385993 [Pilaira anomala]